MVYFNTERLVLRDWTDSDLAKFRKMNKDSEVMEFFPNALSDDETDSFYQRIQDEIKNKGYGLYAAQTMKDGEFIGFIGFHEATLESKFTPCVEIGWRLKKDAWGKGYATEGAKACLKYGFEALGLEKVISLTSKLNIRSQNVMKKIGLKCIAEFDHPNIDKNSALCKHVLYGLSASDWRNKDD